MRTMRLLAATAALGLAAPASADTICEWFDFVETVAQAGGSGGGGSDSEPRPELERVRAQAAIAMFEAVNAIDRRYRSYVGLEPVAPDASQKAAAVTAAARVLLARYPAQKEAIEGSLAMALSGIAGGEAKVAGIRIGEEAAKRALDNGMIDPAIVQVPYRPLTTPGTYVGTQLPITAPHMLAFRPWVLRSVTEVRPAAPPALTSERYARDLNEVQRLGGRRSSARTAADSMMARYRVTPTMTPTLRVMADQGGRRMVDNARLFALYTMIADDVWAATSDAKLHYNFWRPVTAIRNADRDDNPATTVDPGWLPMMNTPPHGEYPCAHCSYAGGMAELMTRLDGERPKLRVRVGSRSLPNAAVQELASWDEWVAQVNHSRILGGVHYRFSNEAGEEIGRRTARLALERVLTPLPASEVRGAR